MERSPSPTNARPRKRAILIAVTCGFLFILPSCAIPRLRNPKPGPQLPADFNGAASPDNSSAIKVEDFFQDPRLTGLMHQAVLGNQELRILNEDVQIASNEILARQGQYLPFVWMGGDAGMNRFSRYTFEGAVEEQLNILPGHRFPNPLPNFSFGPTFFWTPDIWRQLHNAKDAAAMRYYALGEQRSFFVTRLVAELADSYYELLALDKRLEILDQTIALQEQSLRIARAKMEAARGSELAVQRFLAEVRRNQGEKLVVRQSIIEVENRINFLTGRYPQPVERTNTDILDVTLQRLSVGVPSELLRNRPDVREAERQLAAAGLDVKVARKRFLPAMTITSGVGYSSFNPSYLLLSPNAIVANAASNLLVPVINRKAIKADYFSANARQLQSVYNYQRVVLNAFTEVVNRLNRVENYRKSLELRQQQLTALEKSVDVAQKLFQFARADYVDVLFAQRDLRDGRVSFVEIKQQQLAAVVDTYQALGGGSYLMPVSPPRPLLQEHKSHVWMWQWPWGKNPATLLGPPGTAAAGAGGAAPGQGAAPGAGAGDAAPPPPEGERGLATPPGAAPGGTTPGGKDPDSFPQRLPQPLPGDLGTPTPGEGPNPAPMPPADPGSPPPPDPNVSSTPGEGLPPGSLPPTPDPGDTIRPPR
ncbi:Cation efflux system protein CusC precursor [Aquisphaera giovannonii]|uniref:Cation efflux system protein CusC n=1 Tax=Aquisphaera giovannonii TaxID=406548 RepID=A0A5B9VUJ9_9BACT|nr:TolC family protein [Aquisphaera giovannonii]QEH31764.1 Cation efflux system protein CusC precursor [Aquisphaera giovannonii]